jgi:glyoxylase-like metal-dependent hydrolase (beta-lactamase superfamily II)
MLKIGDFEIHLISDSTVWMDGGGAFGLVPRKLWSHYFPPNADNQVSMTQNCLLVKAHGKTIVVDTGLGEKLDDRARRFWAVGQTGGLRRGLAHLGIRPEDVDLVIDTHLHADHAGGNTRWHPDQHGEIIPTFPNAEYVVQRREYEDALHPNERTRVTYVAENFQPLVARGQLRLLDGDTELLPGITGIVTPGHTPGHMSVRFTSQGEHAAFVCDLASYAVHFEKLAWMTAYDVEPMQTLETKRLWQRWALDTNAVLIFPHDGNRPVGRLIQPGDKVEIAPIDEPLLEV